MRSVTARAGSLDPAHSDPEPRHAADGLRPRLIPTSTRYSLPRQAAA